jgi:PKD repeat protein
MGSKSWNSSGVCAGDGGGSLKGSIMVRGMLAPLFAVTVALLVRSSVRGDFLDSRQLSETGGNVTQCSVGADLSLNAYVAWTTGVGMTIDVINLDSFSHTDLPDPALGSGDPSFATNSMGTTFIVFTKEDPLGGREIYLASNLGGPFVKAPENVSLNPGNDDYLPKLALDISGQPHLVWMVQQGNKTLVVYRPPGGPPKVLGQGLYPGISIDAAGTVYVVYSSNQDIRVVNNRGGTFGPEVAVTRTPFDEEIFPNIAVTGSGVAYVLYSQRNSLYLHESNLGGTKFGPPKLLDSGGVSTPELRVSWDNLSIVYEKHGDLYYILGKVGSVLLSPTRFDDDRVNTSAAETRPSMCVDLRGILHLAFIRNGEVFYTNNSGQLVPQFTAQITQGEFPLEVQFTDLSSGAVERWDWDFGDDSPHSVDRDPVHTYDRAGNYSVTLEVMGTGTRATLFKKDYIFVLDASNKLWIPDQSVLPGQKGIWFPIIASHKDPVKGFQVTGVFDPNVLVLQKIVKDGTALNNYEPEFWGPSISNDPSDPYFFAGVIFDYNPPFEGQTLPPSAAQIITHMIFDCLPVAPQGGNTVVELRNGVGRNQNYNVFEIGQTAMLPVLTSSIVSIIPLDGAVPVPFVRGDVDQNGSVDLSDAIAILAYLFTGGAKPACMDSADVNDTNSVDIADPILLLGFLFLGGLAPAVPFPNFGLDPTEDNLGDC